MKDAPPFWLVWTPNGHTPRYEHQSAASAHAEAQRLARENPGEKFYVLQPISETVRNDIVTRRFEVDEIPF